MLRRSAATAERERLEGLELRRRIEAAADARIRFASAVRYPARFELVPIPRSR